jgi:hypothetical protein
MRTETAIKEIQKQAQFLGLSFLETMKFIEKSPLAHPQKAIEAYRVLKEPGVK